MRIASAVLLAICLSACNRGGPSKEAVRQAVIDHLTGVGMNLNVEVTSVQFNGNQADVVVALTPKSGGTGAAMSMGYHLQQQGSKWVVVGRREPGGSPHGGAAAMPGAAGGAEGTPANPHGGAAPPSGGGKMPSPQDLPPVGQKK